MRRARIPAYSPLPVSLSKIHEPTGVRVWPDGGVSVPINTSTDYPEFKISGRNWKVHIVVAQCFIPNPDNKPIVNHKDGNKKNPRSDNLEWVSYKENSQHAWDTGLSKYKERIKLTRRQILYIRRSETKHSVLAKRYGVSEKTIYNIHYLKTYKNV